MHLNRSQIRILYFLWLRQLPAGRALFERELGISPSMIRQALKGLEKLELVDRMDRRYARYSISINGRAFLKRMDDTLKQLIKQAS
jgi:DNA-binding MarR family transcriptional regulator